MILLLALPVAFLLRTLFGGWQTVMTVEGLRRAQVAYVRNADVFLVSTESGPLALSARSPHLGHGLQYCRSSERFLGAHGEVFDRRGFYLGGPAPRGMTRVAVREENGVVQIDGDDVTEGPPRGAGPQVEPSGRLLCDFPDAGAPAGFAAEP
jgi:hypothetical protein